MKITKQYLKQIILEELKMVQEEQASSYTEQDLQRQKENETIYIDEIKRLKNIIPEIKQFISNIQNADKNESFLKQLRDYALVIWRVVHVPFDEKEVYGKGGGAYGYFAKYNLTPEQKEKFKQQVKEIGLDIFDGDQNLLNTMIKHVEKNDIVLLMAGGYSSEEAQSLHNELRKPEMLRATKDAEKIIRKMRRSGGVLNVSDKD